MVQSIRISAAEGHVSPNQINLRFINGQNQREKVLQVPLPTEFISEEIRWYLEDFAQHNPSERERAADAEAALTEHGKQLSFFVGFSEVLKPSETLATEPMLFIEIEESPRMPACLLWEILERPNLLDSLSYFKSVVVTRVFPDQPADTELKEINFRDDNGETVVLNVLIVSARADLGGDISHRLVAHQVLEGLETISSLSPEVGKMTNVEILHPATFDSLKSHLEGREPGHFTVVHFDVHGSGDESGNVMLEFIKASYTPDGAFTCVVDRRSVEEVGCLLQKHQVGRVVLTACRSTHNASPTGTIPRLLRRHGVYEVVAMSYQVFSRCVQYFTTWFYATLFATRSVAFAVQSGRKSVAHSAARLSRFGTEILIRDDIVPISYRSQGWLDKDYIVHAASAFSKMEISNDDPGIETTLGFGREHDLLRLECMLLESGRPILIVGEPGIGKSVLLNILADWWDRTGCAVANCYFQLSRDPDFTVDKMCRELHSRFKCPGEYSGPNSVIPTLHTQRHLIVIDSLEALTISTARGTANQHTALVKFIRALRGGKTILVFGSRREFSYLSSYTFTLILSGLKTLPAMRFIRHLANAFRESASRFRSMEPGAVLKNADWLIDTNLSESDNRKVLQLIEARKQMADSDLYVTWDTDEDNVYLEEIHKLVNGHPLALLILFQNMWLAGPEITPKRFMLALLEGVPMVTDIQNMLGVNDTDFEGLRSINDLKFMIDRLQHEMPHFFKQAIGLLATFWGVIPMEDLERFQRFEIKESVNSGDRNAELLQMIDRLRSSGSLGELPRELKESLERLQGDKLDLLDERRVHLQVYEHMETQGLLESVPHMKEIIKSLRETLHSVADVDSTVLQVNEAMESHEGFFLFHTIRETLLGMGNGLDDHEKTSLRACHSWEDFLSAGGNQGPATELLSALSKARAAILHPGLEALIKSHLLQIPKDLVWSNELRAEPNSEKAYIKTSPLLTIMLRGYGFWCNDTKGVASHKMALTLLYAFRARRWPIVSIETGTKAWNAAKTETDIEFYNLAAAAALSRTQLENKSLGIFADEAISHSILRLEWFSAHETMRAPVVQMLWESCLDDTLQAIKRLEDPKGRPQKRSWSASFTKSVAEESISLDLRQTELKLFTRRGASILLAMGLLQFYNSFNDARNRRCSAVIKKNVADMRTDSYPLKIIQTALKSTEPIHDLNLKVAKSIGVERLYGKQKAVEKISNDVEKLLSSMSLATARKDTSIENGTDQLTFSSLSAKFTDSIQRVHELIRTKHYDAARALIDDTLETEFEVGQSDPARKSALIFFRAVVNAKQDRLADSVKDLEEYRRLNESSQTKKSTSYMSRMTSFMRRSLIWTLEMEAKSKVHQDTRLQPCGNCYKRRGTRRCLGCLYMLYCSSECQKKHWGEHKKICKKLGSGYSI